eukprot:510955-Rhodomonas_salina.1
MLSSISLTPPALGSQHRVVPRLHQHVPVRPPVHGWRHGIDEPLSPWVRQLSLVAVTGGKDRAC